jgi:hypothetical protein
VCTGVAIPLSGAQFFVQSGPKVDHGGEGAVAIVHRRVQLLVGHLDRSGLLGGGSTVAWGGSGDRFRLHLVACARTRSARDGRWPSFPWSGRGCIARHQGSAQGECKQGELSRPRGRRPHEAEARLRRDRRRRGGQHCVQSAGATGGPSEATACKAGEAGQPRNTRGEANKVSRAPERLGLRCRG